VSRYDRGPSHRGAGFVVGGVEEDELLAAGVGALADERDAGDEALPDRFVRDPPVRLTLRRAHVVFAGPFPARANVDMRFILRASRFPFGID
jgi:hypothetical protein